MIESKERRMRQMNVKYVSTERMKRQVNVNVFQSDHA